MYNYFFDLMRNKDIFTDKELEEILDCEQKARENVKVFTAMSYKIANIITCSQHQYGPIFSCHKKYNLPPLNDETCMRRGLEAFRMVFANYAHKHRMMSYEVYPEKQFLDNGIVMMKGYHGAEEAAKIAEEIKDYPISVHKTLDNLAFHERRSPSIFTLAFNTNLYERITHCLGLDNNDIRHQFQNNTFIQRVHNKPNGNAEGTLVDSFGEDVQKQFHTDTFYSALKFWYFPEEVKVEHGPFCYAEKSCVMTEEKAEWWYRESINAVTGQYPKWKSPGHPEGSLRISREELEGEFDCKMKSIPVPADTLVIGNVHGFHARGFAHQEHIRPAIHGSIRLSDPFVLE